MKKLLLTIGLIILLSVSVPAAIRNIQDNHRLVYNIVDLDGDHVSGETVTLQIQKASNGYWYDFNDDTFKASGWTSKTVNLTEDSTNGLYYYTFNPPSGETTAEEYVFLVDNVSATYGDHQSETAHYQDITVPDNTSITAILVDTGTTLPGTLASVSTNVDEVLTDTGTTLPATIATLDSKSDVIDGVVDSILEDTGTTLPASLASADSSIAVIDGIVDDILVDTGTTLPGTLATANSKMDVVDGVADAILVDTGTTLPATLATINTNVDETLTDTGTTLPASLAIIDSQLDVIEGDAGFGGR